MSIDVEQRFCQMKEQLDPNVLPADAIYSLMDLTCLNEQASTEDIDHLVIKAQRDQVAAICVFQQNLALIPILPGIQRVTVVNFPEGRDAPAKVLADIERAIGQYQADEIDYVFDYQAYLAGDSAKALASCYDAYQGCRQQGKLFKVILETGAFSSMQVIYQLSVELIAQGCDMLKTSTGKIKVGASLPAAFAILSAIKDSQSCCGIKVSGGIKTLQQASTYIHLAEEILAKSVDKHWFRLGASQIT